MRLRQIHSKFGSSIVVAATITALLLFVAVPSSYGDDDRDKCRHRIERAEARLDSAIQRHGEHSREANDRRRDFKDLGALQGLNDITDVTAVGTRWLATAGTILKIEDGHYGLLYSGGGCIDGDSDAFHYIGYAESTDLIHWHVMHGINNPIVSVDPFTMALDSTGVPASSGGTLITVPAKAPVAGNTMGWFAGRTYAPSATLFDPNDITVIFAGYHTARPKNGLGDYRTIGRISLHSSRPIEAIGASGDREEDGD